MDRRITHLGAVAMSAAALTFGSVAVLAQNPVGDGHVTGDDPAAVMDWNDIAVNAVVTVAKKSPPEATLQLAIVQAAVYDAVVAIAGRYQPYGTAITSRPDASIEMAVAAAAHDVLRNLLPDQASDLDAAYGRWMNEHSSLLGIEYDPAVQGGLATGSAAAAAILAQRVGDGMDADVGFTMPPAGPGVWQLPPDQQPLAPWLAKLTPFLLGSPDQFQAPPPPALTSAEWATEFNETKTMGGTDSTERTPEQTLIAQFFSAQAAAQENGALRKVITDHGMDAVEAARLYAMMDMIGSDALTACMNSKYTYMFWRPVFAVAGADTDGNDATVADHAWTPLLATPAHPEYPSNHACFSSAEAKVLADVLGTDQIDFTLTSSVTKDTLPSLTFKTAREYVDTVLNARIWGGLHYRGSDNAGVTVGEQVADWGLTHGFQPVP